MVESRAANGTLQGYRLYLLPQAFKLPCDTKLGIICRDQVGDIGSL